MSIFLQSLIPSSPGLELPIKVDVDSVGDSSFASFLGQSLTRAEHSFVDKLGLAESFLSTELLTSHLSSAIDGDKPHFDPSLPELLGKFFTDIENIAENHLSPGQWQVIIPDPAVLQDLALHAGMNEPSCQQLFQKVDQDGVLNLADLLMTLRGQMAKLTEPPLVAVPETELPFLETMLVKVGVDPAQAAGLIEGSVRGDEKIDLRLLLADLKQYAFENEMAQPLPLIHAELGGSELKTLQNILQQAGVQRSRQVELLPELFTFTTLGPDPDLPVDPESIKSGRLPFSSVLVSDQDWGRMSLDRLIKFLEIGVNDINQQQGKINLPSFLWELENVFQQAGVGDAGEKWSPVVQKSLADVFQALGRTIELSQVHIASRPVAALNHFLEQADLASGLDIPGTGSENNQPVYPLEEPSAAESLFSFISDRIEPRTSFTLRNSDRPPAWLPGLKPLQPLPMAGGEKVVAERPLIAESIHLQQQQVVDQVSSTIWRGLARQEHHLMLQLHPRELGEIRIDLVVRDEQVSVMFSPENSRVKEILESGLEQFRSQMEERGFVLNECNVGDGKDDDPRQHVWQQKKMNFQDNSAGREQQDEGLERNPLPRLQGQGSGKINLVV